MNTKKAGGRTIREVEKLTGIPRRKLKYFIERKLFCPSLRGENGYWLYTDSDIEKLWTVLLYHELGYPDNTVRIMRDCSESVRQMELDKHIQRLSGKHIETENRLLASEFVRYRERTKQGQRAFEFDGFDRNITAFVRCSGTVPLGEEDTVQKREELKQRLCGTLFRTLSELYSDKKVRENLKMIFDLSPAATEAQEQIRILCEMIEREKGLSPDDVLFGIRLIKDLGTMALLLDTLLERFGATDFLVKAVQLYCNKTKENMEVLV